MMVDSDVCTHLPVVAVMLGGKLVYALLDTGSTASYVSREIANELGLEGKNVTYNLNTIECSSVQHTQEVQASVESIDGHDRMSMKFYVSDGVPITVPYVNINDYPHLRHLRIHGNQNPSVHVSVLIGCDNHRALVPLDSVVGSNGPSAIRTIFGWAMCDKTSAASADKVGQQTVATFLTLNIEKNVNKLWDIEQNPLREDLDSYSQEDFHVVNLWDSQTKLVDNHYVVPIPWKNSTPSFPNNFGMAMSRYNSLMRKLNSDPESKNLYNKGIQKMINLDHAEEVPSDELNDSSGTVWYLPHHGVKSENKPGKLRIVFDCSATKSGVSLNNQSLPGPNLLNRLCNVLSRFRQYQYAFMADIEAMYPQVRIPEKDRNALRFIWHDGNGIKHYRLVGHPFGGVWCSSVSTYALLRTVKDNTVFPQEIRNIVSTSFYVDDCLKSYSNPDLGDMMHMLKLLLSCGGFNLTKFVSNVPKALESMNTEDLSKEVKDLNLDVTCQALGVQWDINSDSFRYHISAPPGGPITRRKILSYVASVYDPLGLITPVILGGRLLFQESTRVCPDQWDSSLPPSLVDKWSHWVNTLQEVQDNISIPRCYFPFSDTRNVAKYQLHVFCDASLLAYGTCVYITQTVQNQPIRNSLVVSRARVAPGKATSIPRLELQAAVLAVEVESVVYKELEFDLLPSVFYTDSEIVLRYISNDSRRFKVYVANRVSKIQNYTEVSQWHYVSSKENPADMLSRAHVIDDTNVQSWLSGPDLLRSQDMLVEKPLDFSDDDGDPEVKKIQIYTCTSMETKPVLPLDSLLARYSDYHKLVRAVAWLLRLKKRLLTKTTPPAPYLTVQELSDAKHLLFTHSQLQSYKTEIEDLNDHGYVSKHSSLRKLNPTISDSGILVVHGRLGESFMSDQAKRPIILSPDHILTKLIVSWYHNVFHGGIEWVLSLVRKQFWIPRGRKIVKSVARKCLLCKKLFSKPQPQFMAPLLKERCDPQFPFIHVGLDCCGPFLEKYKRATVKVWVCLFTCMVTRAVHLERLTGLDTESFINGLRRFVARRGNPKVIFCDNGTNFVGTRNIFVQLNQNSVSKFCATKDIEWHFIPPLSPHMGGAWERLVGVVKRVLCGILPLHSQDRALNPDVLCTVLAEVESIVNSRPLTKVSSDCTDLNAITPNHILLLREGPPPLCFQEKDRHRQLWRQVQYYAGQFWRRFLREYIPMLQSRQKWLKKERNFQVGDLVLICQESLPRGLWPLAIVQSVNVGRDGLVRSVKVKTSTTSLVRPITKLVLLESQLF